METICADVERRRMRMDGQVMRSGSLGAVAGTQTPMVWGVTSMGKTATTPPSLERKSVQNTGSGARK